MDTSTLIKLGVGAAIGVNAVSAGLLVLGFGGAGVAAGSVAALMQSKIGVVAGGSIFSVCQSIGAAGLATSTKVCLGCAGAIAAKKFF